MILKLDDSFWNSEALGLCITVQLVISALPILPYLQIGVCALPMHTRPRAQCALHTQNPEPRFDVEIGALQCSHV